MILDGKWHEQIQKMTETDTHLRQIAAESTYTNNVLVMCRQDSFVIIEVEWLVFIQTALNLSTSQYLNKCLDTLTSLLVPPLLHCRIQSPQLEAATPLPLSLPFPSIP